MYYVQNSIEKNHLQNEAQHGIAEGSRTTKAKDTRYKVSPNQTPVHPHIVQ